MLRLIKDPLQTSHNQTQIQENIKNKLFDSPPIFQNLEKPKQKFTKKIATSNSEGKKVENKVIDFRNGSDFMGSLGKSFKK